MSVMDIFTARQRSCRKVMLSEASAILFTVGLCMMSLPVWLPGPMFLQGVSRGVSVKEGLCEGGLCERASLLIGDPQDRGLHPPGQRPTSAGQRPAPLY